MRYLLRSSWSRAGNNMHRNRSKKVISVTKEKLSCELKREQDQCQRLTRRAFQVKGTTKTKAWGVGSLCEGTRCKKGSFVVKFRRVRAK